LSVNYIKIDGSFVRDAVTTRAPESMIKAIAQLAKVMCMETIAEYVETDLLRVRMADLGVDYGQGFAMGKAQRLEDLLQELAFYEPRSATGARRRARWEKSPPNASREHARRAQNSAAVGAVLQRIQGIPHRKKIGRVYKCAMLILTRRAGESLRIGDDVEVTVMAVNGAQVRIGIRRPSTSAWIAKKLRNASARAGQFARIFKPLAASNRHDLRLSLKKTAEGSPGCRGAKPCGAPYL